MSSGSSPYRKHKNDVESGGGGSGGFEDYESPSDPFDIVSTKSASVDRLKRWRVMLLFFFIGFFMCYSFNIIKEYCEIVCTFLLFKCNVYGVTVNGNTCNVYKGY